MAPRITHFGPPGHEQALVSITVDARAPQGVLPPERAPIATARPSRESPGHTVAVVANLHGDECTGIGAIHALLPILDRDLQNGMVRLFPSLNPEGLRARTRRLPDDDQDLNRLFPGDPKGPVGNRLAWSIWEAILAPRPSVVLDLHSDATGSIPYAIVDRPVSLKGSMRDLLVQRSLAFARATGLAVLWDYSDRQYRAWHLERSLTGALMNRAQIPALTLEVGPRLYLDPDAVRQMVDAVLGVLGVLGMLNIPARPRHTPFGAEAWRRESGPITSVAGILVPCCQPGQKLESGEILAEVRDLQGRILQRLAAPSVCHVLSLSERTWVQPGTTSVTLAVPEGDPR